MCGRCKHLYLVFLTLLLFSSAEAFGWNVFMAGDSHVCSKIYPDCVEKILSANEPEINFAYFGKIGAGFYTFVESPSLMGEIFDASPDILIVHLGTNDSFTSRFVKSEFLKNVRIFYEDVEKNFPECKIVFVTPFYNRLHGSSKPNGNTRRCADALLDFARGRSNAFVVDNNADHGMYFLNHRASLMRHDCVHLTEKGYEELGQQIGEALVALDDLWVIAEPPYLE